MKAKATYRTDFKYFANDIDVEIDPPYKFESDEDFEIAEGAVRSISGHLYYCGGCWPSSKDRNKKFVAVWYKHEEQAS